MRRSYQESGEIGPGREIPVPGLADAASRCAVPAMAKGELVGVLTVESREPVAYGPADEAVLTVIAGQLAAAIQADQLHERDAAPASTPHRPATTTPAGGASVQVRFFEVDGSVFLDGDYLIKGVAGRLLGALLDAHAREGRTEFTNREMRLDPTLDLPAFKDNFESRLILLKRRLDEREAPDPDREDGAGAGSGWWSTPPWWSIGSPRRRRRSPGDGVAAGALGSVEGLVGTLHQLVGGAGAGVGQGDADAGAQR